MTDLLERVLLSVVVLMIYQGRFSAVSAGDSDPEWVEVFAVPLQGHTTRDISLKGKPVGIVVGDTGILRIDPKSPGSAISIEIEHPNIARITRVTSSNDVYTIHLQSKREGETSLVIKTGDIELSRKEVAVVVPRFVSSMWTIAPEPKDGNTVSLVKGYNVKTAGESFDPSHLTEATREACASFKKKNNADRSKEARVILQFLPRALKHEKRRIVLDTKLHFTNHSFLLTTNAVIELLGPPDSQSSDFSYVIRRSSAHSWEFLGIELDDEGNVVSSHLGKSTEDAGSSHKEQMPNTH